MTESELLTDFLHYILIDRNDLAAAMGQELLDRKMDPVAFAALVEAGDAERFDSTARRALRVRELESIAGSVLRLYEHGKLARARNPQEIDRNIAALTGPLRGKLLAKGRLVAAGEYAVPALLNGLLDRSNTERAVQCQDVLIELGRQSIVPLCTAIPGLPPAQQELVVDILGQIPYRTSLPFLADLQEISSNSNVKEACNRAITRLGGAGGETAALFGALAEAYYDEKNELTSFPSDDYQVLWSFDPAGGLQMASIRTQVFHEAMAMRMAERAMVIQKKSGGILPETVALWVASNFSREIDTPSGYVNPAYPVEGAALDGATPRRSATYFGVAAGADVAQRVLARAIDRRDTPLARRAISCVEQTVGHSMILGQAGGRAPLVDALTYPNRRVQFEAALAIAAAQPASKFAGSDRVVPTLASSLRNATQQTAAVIANEAEVYQGIRSALESMGYTVFSQGRSLSELELPISEAGSVDLVVGVVSTPERAGPIVSEVRNHSKLAATPILFLTGQETYIELGRRYGSDGSIMVRPLGLPAETLLRAAYELVQTSSGGVISSDEAELYSTRSLTALRDLAVSNNQALPVTDAASMLIAALPEATGESKMRIAEVLCRMSEERAQRTVLDAALAAKGEEQVRLLGLASESAKRYGNRLERRQLTSLVQLAREGDDASATAAAAMMGSLNLANEDLLGLIVGKGQ
jgi:DNA-binding response OmpR family regulator